MTQDSNTSNNKRLAKNTIVLYFRMMIIMGINLYISRAVLSILGVSDFGIYNVVGGFVTMFSLLSGSLSNAISRYITFEIGRGNSERIKRVFSTSVTVQIFISLGIGVFLETIGVWFLNYKMQIPADRIYAANWVLQCSIVTFILNLISIPYNGCIIAYERMTAYAYISILEAILRLISVLVLFFDFGNKLIIYAILLTFSAAIVRLIYGIYCDRNFEECKYHFFLDKALMKEISSMASWNILGSAGGILNNHGVNLLINIFFGVALNTARGLSVQVNNAVQQFAGSFITALNPQITKYYSIGQYDEMRKLVFTGAKFSYFLMLFISLPIIIETPIILKFWLNTIPEYTVVFIRLTLILSLTAVLSNIMFTVAMATGNIKKYQIVVGSLSLSIFFFTYIGYKLGGDVTTTYYITFIIDLLVLAARLYIVNGLVHIGIRNFIKSVIVPVIGVTIFSSIMPLLLYHCLEKSIASSLIVIVSCFICTFITVLTLGLTALERMKLKNIVKLKMHQ